MLALYVLRNKGDVNVHFEKTLAMASTTYGARIHHEQDPF